MYCNLDDRTPANSRKKISKFRLPQTQTSTPSANLPAHRKMHLPPTPLTAAAAVPIAALPKEFRVPLQCYLRHCVVCCSRASLPRFLSRECGVVPMARGQNSAAACGDGNFYSSRERWLGHGNIFLAPIPMLPMLSRSANLAVV